MPDPIPSFQRIREKALQLKRAVDAAPARAAQLKEAVAVTTGRLKQLRTDVESTVAALRSDTDGSLAETLVELDDCAGWLARAGYELSGVDIEQGPAPRVIVHLEQASAARTDSLEALQSECTGQRLAEAILGALIRAEELEEGIHLADLVFHGLTIHVGPIPTVRLCWRRPAKFPASRSAAAAAPYSTVTPHASSPSPSPMPSYGAESFFERVEAGTSPAAAMPAAPAMATTAPTPSRVRPPATETPGVPLTGDWRKDALARFKKMPDLSR